MNVFEKIRNIVKQIPEGKVASYGMIAELAGITNPRIVGWALSKVSDNTVPAHRVVMKDGSLSKNFSDDGWAEQLDMLEDEGIKDFDFKSKVPKVDMRKYLWRV